MITPYFVSYAPLITILIERKTFEKATSSNRSSKCGNFLRRAFGCFFLTPLSLTYFILLDVVYIILELTTNTLSLLLFVFSLGKIKTKLGADELLDKLFSSAFKLKRMDVAGLRRLRTISQLIFESVP